MDAFKKQPPPFLMVCYNLTEMINMPIQKQTAILFCLFFLALSFPVRAENVLTADAIDLSNAIMHDIFKEIIDRKSSHSELREFSEAHLSKNEHGIYSILYEVGDSSKDDSFSLGVTINTTDDHQFSGRPGIFNYGFPKVNLKISGFQQKHPLRTQFDLMPLVMKHGMRLAEYQQKFLPLKIEIRPVKDVFQVREDIMFDVVLKNVSKRHMIIKSLGKETLFFLINNQTWGTSPLSGRVGGNDEVLKSGQETILRIKGESFQKPQVLEITCFYNMSIEGVNPIGKISIEIE